MPKVTFIEGFVKDLDNERPVSGIFVLAAVTSDGKVSEILFPTERDRTHVISALGGKVGYPPEEVSAERLQEFGFDLSRLS